ncbi:MAG TPA: hypothetical protein ENI69_04315 [Rhodospirillales bacterium]|nr:hypothetical protein [Rhodospirillales bacterium]
MGRLKFPIAAVGHTDTDLPDWLAANPDGRIIVINPEPSTESPDVYNQAYRQRTFSVFPVADVIANPSLLE